jgi:LmbE family N-acetylglucosaminyl deacetylase
MKLSNPKAEIFIPDGKAVDEAFKRTTHMGIGAHQDDLEFMALHGILECYQNDKNWFTGVTVTDGSGSSRVNEYAKYSDEDMKQVRRKEQNKAAVLGEYSAMISLDYPSSVVKNPSDRKVIEDLKTIISTAKPDFIYTHNLADKHDTHIAVAIPVIEALRELPVASRPKSIYGCEVWRNLDWMLDEDKVVLDVSARENLSMALMGLFDSQISGGKRYDLATQGRKRANATYFASHKTDQAKMLEFAMDLTPLIKDSKLDINHYVQTYIQRFADDVKAKISKRLGK